MTTTIGYARISTDGETLDAQQAALSAAGCDRVFAEKISGAVSDRPALRKAIAALGPGDTLIVTRLDRLARSTRDLLNILDTIGKRQACFKSLADPWADTTTDLGKLIATVLGGIAEFERSLIRARTADGRVRAKARGVRFGRKLKLSKFQIDDARHRREAGERLRDIARSYGVSHSLIARALVAVAAMLVISGVDSYAQQPQRTPEARIIVSGEGSVSVMPDYAEINSGVTTRSKTVKDGVEANSRLMVAIVAALKNAGISEKDIQTVRFSIQPVYAPQEPRTEPRLSGYSVFNKVNVTVREIGKVGDVLDRLVAAGATDVGNVAFLISDPSKGLDEAREAAMADAQRKGEVYAKAAGVRLGRVEWITEDTGVAPSVPVMARASRARANSRSEDKNYKDL